MSIQSSILSMLLDNSLTKQTILAALVKSYNLLIENQQISSNINVQHYKEMAALQALILSVVRQNKIKLPQQKKILPWKDYFGVMNQSNKVVYAPDSDICGQKTTNKDHHFFLLNKLKKQKLEHVIQIHEVTQFKERPNDLQIIEEKALSFKSENTNYIKQNIFFNTYTDSDQIQFLQDSIKGVIQLNYVGIDHNDITFRNFVYSMKDLFWKVIDFDISCKYEVFFKKNPEAQSFNSQKIKKLCPSQISSQGNYISKTEEQLYIQIYKSSQINELYEDYRKFRSSSKNIGKRDAIMYGFMVLRLLYQCYPQQSEINVNKKVAELIKKFRQKQKMENYQFMNEILQGNFSHRYYELVKLIFNNLMSQSSKQRKNLYDIQKQWSQILAKAAVAHSVSTNSGPHNQKNPFQKKKAQNSQFKNFNDYKIPFQDQNEMKSRLSEYQKYNQQLNNLNLKYKRKSSQIKEANVTKHPEPPNYY